MHRRLFLAFIISFLLIPIVHAESCDYGANVYLYLEAIENSQHSKYQFPDFKEDTTVTVQKIIINNTGNCTFPESYLKIHLINPKEEKIQNIFYGYYNGMPIPGIKVGEYYEIQETNYPYYIDNLNNSFFLGGVTLTNVGKWKFDYSLELKTHVTPGYNYNLLIENSYLKEFNVYSRFDMQKMEVDKSNLIMNYSGLIMQYLLLFISILALMAVSTNLYYSHLKGPNIKITFGRFRKKYTGYLTNIPIKVNLPFTLFNDGTDPGYLKSIKLKKYKFEPNNKKFSVELNEIKDNIVPVQDLNKEDFG